MKPTSMSHHDTNSAPKVAALVLTVAIVFSGCGESPAPPPEPPVLPARYAEMLGDPPAPPKLDLAYVDHAVVAAIEKAEDEVRKDSQSVDAWGKLGMVLLAHEFNEPAAACLAQTEFMQPDDPRWAYLQATSMIRLRPNDAVPLLERAVRLLPAEARGGATEDRPHSAPRDAESTNEASKEVDVAAAIRLRLLELYLELDRPADAEKPLREFLESDPQNGRAHLIAARIALRAGRLDECLREVELAGYQRPAQKPVHELRAEVYSRQRRRDDAESERRMAAAAPNASWPGPYDDEIESLQTGLKIALSKADRLYVIGRTEASIDVLKPTLEEYPQSEWAWILVGRAQIRLRQLDEAEQSLAKALAITPNSADAMFRMGVVQDLRGETDEAAAWFRKVVEQKRDHPVALYNLGHCARKLDDAEQAIDYFRQALEAGPNYFEAMCALGDVLADEGRVEEARKYLEQAKKIRPRDRWVLNRLYQLPDKSAEEDGIDDSNEQKPAETDPMDKNPGEKPPE